MSVTTHRPDVEEIVARFRDWLAQVSDTVDALPLDQDSGSQPASPPVGLVQLIEQFTALRHEVKLSTKSARALEQQSAAALGGLEQAIAALRSVQPKEAEAAHRAAQPLVQTLAELDEALRRCRAVVESARRQIVEESPAALLGQLDAHFRRQPWGFRWLASAWYRGLRRLVERQSGKFHAAIFDSLLAGYELVQNRLHRAMARAELVRVACVGKPVDPHAMTVIEAVDDPTQAPGTVVEEIRPGYLWKGKVLQYAEVRAVRQPSASRGP
jgi:molecular chaperone GrpE